MASPKQESSVKITFASGDQMELPQSFDPVNPGFFTDFVASALTAGRQNSSGPSNGQTPSASVQESSSIGDQGLTHTRSRQASMSSVMSIRDLVKGEVSTLGVEPFSPATTSPPNRDGHLRVVLRRPTPQVSQAPPSAGPLPKLFTYTTTRPIIRRRHDAPCTPCFEEGLECVDQIGPAAWKCLGCSQRNIYCDWGATWFNHDRVKTYMRCLNQGMTPEQADEEVYGCLGVLGGPLDSD